MKEIIMDGNENFGINYYHESMGYNNDWNKDDFEILKRITNKIKVYHHPYSLIDNVLQICQLAKANGMYVVFNENFDGNGHISPDWIPCYTTLTTEKWAEYCEKVKSNLLLVKDYIDEFLVGNEMSIHNDGSEMFNDTNLPLNIKALVNDCKKLANCKFSFQDGWWKKGSWYNSGLGNLDKIYFTLYENNNGFENTLNDIYKKFGDKAVIGEWSTQTGTANIDGWGKQLEERKAKMKAKNIENYIFTFREDGSFGVYRDNKIIKEVCKKIHYCDHDEKDISKRSGCRIDYQDLEPHINGKYYCKRCGKKN